MDFAMFEKVANNSGSEEGIVARFYDRTVKTQEIADNGLPKFKQVCFCEIRIKDNISEVFDQPATEDKIKRFPVEYARYQLAKKQVAEGTPLEQFAFLDRAEIESLKIHGIFTVETLAALSADRAVLLGIEKERQLAEKFLLQAKDNLSLKNWQQKEEKYLAKIAQLEEKLALLSKDKKSSPAKKARKENK